MTIAFLYADGPSGHSRAADALAAQLKESEPAIQTPCLEFASRLHPLLGPILTRTYLKLIRKTPKLWDYLYDNQTVARAIREFRAELSFFHRRKLREAIEGIGPDCIVCTHAIPCATLALEKERGRLPAPLVAVPTDFGIHAYWISEHVDLYLAPTEETREELIRRGIRPSRIQVTGIPVDPRLRRPPARVQARKDLALDPERSTVLVSGGSKGVGPILKTVAALSARMPRVQILAACGANRKLRETLSSRYPRVRAMAFTEDMSACWAAADLAVGKAGGMSASEALCVGLPMIILAPLPGQEERNARFLTARGAAVRAENPDEAADRAKSLLADPAGLSRMRQAAARLGRPHSAQIACELIARLARERSALRAGKR